MTSVYSDQVLDHFQNPRNVGELPGADVCVELQNPACGDVLRLAIKVLDGRIAEVRFRAKGCVAAIACASRLTETITAMNLEQILSLRREHIMESLGGLPPASTHAAQLAIEALGAALKKIAAHEGR